MDEFQLKVVTTLPSEAVVDLYKDAGWWEQGWSIDAIPAMISGSFRFVGLFRGDELVGMARALSDGASDGYIQDVVVRSDLRGQGWGGRIVAFLVKELRAAGVDWIGLIGVPDSAPFYQKLGFTVMPDFVPMKFQC